MSIPVRSHRSIPSLFLRWGLPLLVALLLPAIAHAQEGGQQVDTIGQPHPSTQPFSLEYDRVFDGVKSALEKHGYTLVYSSRKRNMIQTSFVELTYKDRQHADNFEGTMNQYGSTPYVRSPDWKNGRYQLTATLKEEGGHISVTVIAVLSGFEARFENRWLYWTSNGKLEKEAMDAITAELAN